MSKLSLWFLPTWFEMQLRTVSMCTTPKCLFNNRLVLDLSSHCPTNNPLVIPLLTPATSQLYLKVPNHADLWIKSHALRYSSYNYH